MPARPAAWVATSLLHTLRVRATHLAITNRAAREARLLGGGGGGTHRRQRQCGMAAAAGGDAACAAPTAAAGAAGASGPSAARLLDVLAIPPLPGFALPGAWVEHVLAPREGLLSDIITEALSLPEVGAALELPPRRRWQHYEPQPPADAMQQRHALVCL